MTLNRLIKPIILSCTLPLAFSANATDNFFSLNAGLDQPVVGSNNGNLNSEKVAFVGGAEVGRKFMDRFSLSLEYKYFAKSNFNIDTQTQTSDTDTFSWAASSNVFMANFAFDLVQMEKFTPYIKVGAGIAMNKSYDYNQSLSNQISKSTTWKGKTVNKFAWQVGAGFDFHTTEMFNTTIAYSFINRGKFETNYAIEDKKTTSTKKYTNLQDHVFTVGIKFKF